MIIVALLVGLPVAFVFGVLFGRKNKKTVEKILADTKAELEKLKSQLKS